MAAMEFVKINHNTSASLLTDLQTAVKKQLDNNNISEADVRKFINLVNNTLKLKTVIKYL